MNIQYLNNVASARDSLKLWLSNLEQKHRGIQMFSKEKDTDRENTEFYKWYYGEGQTFSSFEAFREIESHYHKMFDHFIAYNKLSKTPIKKTWFSNNTKNRKTELNVIFKRIEFTSIALIEHITFFENKLIESPLFSDISKSDIPEVTEAFENKAEDIFNVVDKITPKSYEKPVDEENKNIIETADDNKKEESILPIFKEKPFDDMGDTLFEIGTEDEVVEEEIVQKEEKKAILEIPKKEQEKKQKEDNNTILPEIDIEEEIRRILS